jgi:hypothetical protein
VVAGSSEEEMFKWRSTVEGDLGRCPQAVACLPWIMLFTSNNPIRKSVFGAAASVVLFKAAVHVRE